MIVPRQIPDTAAIASHYDDLDLIYREVWGEHVHHGVWLRGDESPEEAVLQLVNMVAERARLKPGDRVCDAGCGYGATARFLADRFLSRVTGYTLSEQQIQYARSIRPDSPNPAYKFCDWFDNGLVAESIDAVISVESTEHMDKEKFVAEARRLLKTGGRLVISAWLAADESSRWEARHLLEPICREGRLPSLASEREFREWLTKYGFELDGWDNLSHNVRRTWTLCVRRFAAGLFHKPAFRRALWDSTNRNRVFGLTILRIWLAYQTGAMRYGLFSARKM